MVLEHIFPEYLLEKKSLFAFLVGIVYSTCGIIAARIIFPANSGIVSVMFTSLLILPYLRKLFAKEEKKEESEKTYTFYRLYNDSRASIKTYMAIFVGIFTAYLMYSFIMPQFGFNTFIVFREQLFGASLGSSFLSKGFLALILNNLFVLLACFMIALFTADGAIFFIVWNASSWGTIFGYRAVSASFESGANPWLYLLIILAFTFVHMLLEGLSYIMAATSGSVISDKIIRKAKEARIFALYLVLGAIMFLVVRFYFGLAGSANAMYFGLFALFAVVIFMYSFSRIFAVRKHQEIFVYNNHLFLLAVLIMLISAVLEVAIAGNSDILGNVYRLSSNLN
jgi:hypothetical protein